MIFIFTWNKTFNKANFNLKLKTYISVVSWIPSDRLILFIFFLIAKFILFVVSFDSSLLLVKFSCFITNCFFSVNIISRYSYKLHKSPRVHNSNRCLMILSQSLMNNEISFYKKQHFIENCYIINEFFFWKIKNKSPHLDDSKCMCCSTQNQMKVLRLIFYNQIQFDYLSRCFFLLVDNFRLRN